MLKKTLLLILAVSITCIKLNSISIGTSMPEFRVESGDAKILSSTELDHKIIFFFYDHKDSFQYNNEFKASLFLEYEALLPQQQKDIAIVQIIDCSTSNFINRYFYKKGLVNNSRKYGFRIWGDWDGKVRERFGFAAGLSYMLIFDKDGKAVYNDQHQFKKSKIKKITRLLDHLFSNNKCR